MSLALEDKLAIHELLATHLRHLDNHDVDAWTQCWVPEGRFVATYGTNVGHEEIRGFLQGHIAAGKEDGARHLATNVIVSGEGDKVNVYSLVVKLQVEKPPFIIATGVYNDVVVRTNEGWRFEVRQLDIDRGAFAAAEAAN